MNFKKLILAVALAIPLAANAIENQNLSVNHTVQNAVSSDIGAEHLSPRQIEIKRLAQQMIFQSNTSAGEKTQYNLNKFFSEGGFRFSTLDELNKKSRESLILNANNLLNMIVRLDSPYGVPYEEKLATLAYPSSFKWNSYEIFNLDELKSLKKQNQQNKFYLKITNQMITIPAQELIGSEIVNYIFANILTRISNYPEIQDRKKHFRLSKNELIQISNVLDVKIKNNFEDQKTALIENIIYMEKVLFNYEFSEWLTRRY